MTAWPSHRRKRLDRFVKSAVNLISTHRVATAATVAAVVITVLGVLVATRSGSESPTVSVGVEIVGADLAPMESFGSTDEPQKDLAIGSLAPTFTAQTLEGEPFTFETGAPTLMVFASHWCDECPDTLAAIQQLRQSKGLPRSIDVVVVMTGSDRKKVGFPPANWLRQIGWGEPAVADSAASQLALAFGMDAPPYALAIDERGRVVLRANGQLGSTELKKLILAVR